MKQLIYATLDLRRALWVPEATGALVLCSYKSDLLTWMRKNGAEVWCFEELYPEDKLPRTTSELLGNAKTLKWLRSLGKDLSFLVFKPSNRIHSFIRKEGWELLAPDPTVCRQLEDKITFFELAKKYELSIPMSEIILWEENKVEDYRKNFGDPMIVQERMGHAGSCTHVVRSSTKFNGLKSGARVKISEFISGPTYTFNAYVSPGGKLVVSRVYQQLMDVPQWNEFEMGTVGISPELNLSEETYVQLKDLLVLMVPLFQEVKYAGFFGLDLIWNGKKWYLIECNPRFTASISLQCLTDLANGKTPILKLHAEQTEPAEHRFDFLEKPDDSFGHVVLRNSKNRSWKIPRTLKSGVYYQKEGKWQLKNRSYDARELEGDELLLILANEAGTEIEPGSDFAALQYKGSAYESGKICDRFFDFYERVVIGYFIRAKDFWQDRYASVDGHCPIFSKPSSGSRSQMAAEVLFNETIKLLGEYGTFFLVERADGTRGWMISSTNLQSANIDQFQFPNKQSTTAESFFQHWNGKPYLYGGNTEQGIDCSAFVQRYFWEVKGILLPKNSQDQKAFCSQEVSENELKDDDLVFLHHLETRIPHVGIVQNGKIWHSSLENGVVKQGLEALKEKYTLDAFKRF